MKTTSVGVIPQAFAVLVELFLYPIFAILQWIGFHKTATEEANEIIACGAAGGTSLTIGIMMGRQQNSPNDWIISYILILIYVALMPFSVHLKSEARRTEQRSGLTNPYHISLAAMIDDLWFILKEIVVFVCVLLLMLYEMIIKDSSFERLLTDLIYPVPAFYDSIKKCRATSTDRLSSLGLAIGGTLCLAVFFTSLMTRMTAAVIFGLVFLVIYIWFGYIEHCLHKKFKRHDTN